MIHNAWIILYSIESGINANAFFVFNGLLFVEVDSSWWRVWIVQVGLLSAFWSMALDDKYRNKYKYVKKESVSMVTSAAGTQVSELPVSKTTEKVCAGVPVLIIIYF